MIWRKGAEQLWRTAKFNPVRYRETALYTSYTPKEDNRNAWSKASWRIPQKGARLKPKRLLESHRDTGVNSSEFPDVTPGTRTYHGFRGWASDRVGSYTLDLPLSLAGCSHNEREGVPQGEKPFHTCSCWVAYWWTGQCNFNCSYPPPFFVAWVELNSLGSKAHIGTPLHWGSSHPQTTPLTSASHPENTYLLSCGEIRQEWCG